MCNSISGSIELDKILGRITAFRNDTSYIYQVITEDIITILVELDEHSYFLNEYVLEEFLFHEGCSNISTSFNRDKIMGTIGNHFIIFSSAAYHVARAIEILQAKFTLFKFFKIDKNYEPPKTYSGTSFYFALGPYRIAAKHMQNPLLTEKDYQFFLTPTFNTLYLFQPTPGVLLNGYDIDPIEYTIIHYVSGVSKVEPMYYQGKKLSIFNFSNPVVRKYFKIRALYDLYFINTCSTYRFKFFSEVNEAQRKQISAQRELIANIQSPLDKFQFIQKDFQFGNCYYEAHSDPKFNKHKYSLEPGEEKRVKRS